MTKMVEGVLWQCPPGLIDRALTEHPIKDKRVTLNYPTGDFFYDRWEIKDEFKGTVWQEVLDTLPMSIGEARIITLDPEESYSAHADIDDRWHLNLTGEHAYLIDLDNRDMFECKRNNHWYIMDAGRIHSASNYGSIPRLQLVVREPLRTSRQPKNLIKVTIEPSGTAEHYRYVFDNIISPWLNVKNKNYQMANFSYLGPVVRFKLEAECKDELDALLTKDFIVTYE